MSYPRQSYQKYFLKSYVLTFIVIPSLKAISLIGICPLQTFVSLILLQRTVLYCHGCFLLNLSLSLLIQLWKLLLTFALCKHCNLAWKNGIFLFFFSCVRSSLELHWLINILNGYIYIYLLDKYPSPRKKKW